MLNKIKEMARMVDSNVLFATGMLAFPAVYVLLHYAITGGLSAQLGLVAILFTESAVAIIVYWSLFYWSQFSAPKAETSK